MKFNKVTKGFYLSEDKTFKITNRRGAWMVTKDNSAMGIGGGFASLASAKAFIEEKVAA